MTIAAASIPKRTMAHRRGECLIGVDPPSRPRAAGIVLP
jgi:hypothetical protein